MLKLHFKDDKDGNKQLQIKMNLEEKQESKKKNRFKVRYVKKFSLKHKKTLKDAYLLRCRDIQIFRLCPHVHKYL